MGVDDCELRLSFDVAVMCRLFEPTYPFRAAGRNANAIEIAAPDAVHRLGQPGTAGGGHQRGPTPQCCGRRKYDLHSLEQTPISHASHAARGPLILRTHYGSRIPYEAAAGARPS